MELLNFNNPFTQIKFRYLALRFICIALLTGLISAILRESGFFSLLRLNQSNLSLILYTIQLVLLCLWLRKDFQRLRVKFKYIIGEYPEKENWSPFARLAYPSVIFFGAAYIVVSYFASLLIPILRLIPSNILNSLTVQVSNYFVPNILINAAFCVVTAIAEEFIFRGVILQRFCTKWGTGAGLLYSSLLYGCFYVNPVGVSLLGILFGLIYIYGRSLVVLIAVNAWYKFVTTSMALLNGDSQTRTPIEKLLIPHAYWWVGIILMLITLPFFLRFIQSYWPKKNTLIPYLSNAIKEQAMVQDKGF